MSIPTCPLASILSPAEAKKPRTASEEVADLQRQLKAALQAREEAREAYPVAITKTQLNKLRRAFHPDGEARVSQERKAELTAAFQIFSRLKFEICDRD